MLGKSEQLFFNETFDSAVGTVWTSKAIKQDGYVMFDFLCSLGAAPTGTTPTLSWQAQTSNDGITWANSGSALANMTPAILQIAAAFGAAAANAAITSATWVRFVGTIAGANAKFTQVFAELVAHA